MEKNVDGIKKLSREELEKSRMIVLDSIGEGQPAGQPAAMSKSVDSIFAKKTEKADPIFAKKAENKEGKTSQKELVVDFLQPLDDIRAVKTEKSPKKIREVKAKEKTKEAKDSGNNDNNENLKKSLDSISKVNPFDSSVVADRIKKAEAEAAAKAEAEIRAKAAAKAEAGREKETKREEKIKREAEDKRKKAEEKREKELKRENAARRKAEEKKKKAEEKAQRKKERQERHRNARKNLRSVFGGFIRSGKNSLKTILLIGLLGLVTGIMLYAAFLIVIIEYRLDNKYLRSVSRYLPIPAYISRDGIVGFYSYLDIKKGLAKEARHQATVEQDIKIKVLENIILNRLLGKYGLDLAVSQENIGAIKEILATIIMDDPEINQVGITRINKIRDLIGEEGDFVKVANTYGDWQDKITVSAADGRELIQNFDKLANIGVGEVSEVLSDQGGYYIYRCFDKRNGNLYLSYVYVKGKSLESYIREASAGYKLWSLVD